MAGPEDGAIFAAGVLAGASYLLLLERNTDRIGTASAQVRALYTYPFGILRMQRQPMLIFTIYSIVALISILVCTRLLSLRVRS